MDPQSQSTARLQIGTDPTVWMVLADQDTVAGQLQQATGPVQFAVVGPLQGELVLSARSAGSVLVLPGPPDVGGTHPGGTHPGGLTPGTHPSGLPPSGADTFAAAGTHPGGGHPGDPGPVGAQPAAAAAAVAAESISPLGTHPSGGGSPTAAAVYLPSLTAATPSSPGHLLAAAIELSTTVGNIKAAMDNSTSVTLQLSADSGGGILVLNGAALAFVVVIMATA